MYYDLFQLSKEFDRVIGYNARESISFPKVNIFDEKEKFVVVAKVAGVDKEDVSITIKENTLKIAGEIKPIEGNVYSKERFSGKFERTFCFDDNVDEERVNAELKNGVLTIELGKSEEVKPRVVTIK